MLDDPAADAALVGRAQRGDIAAMALLFERHRARLYASAVMLLHDRDEAADAVQDTFVSALTHITTVRDPEAVHWWLRTILTNSCRMRLRSHRPQLVEPAELTGMSEPDGGPEELLEKAATGRTDSTSTSDIPSSIPSVTAAPASHKSRAKSVAMPSLHVATRSSRAVPRLVIPASNVRQLSCRVSHASDACPQPSSRGAELP